MCGIVGAVSKRDVTPILIEGLRRLEYRGYDSAGIAVVDEQNQLRRCRAIGKVHRLEEALVANPLAGHIGIAHTRWATHGAVTHDNAHPHASNDEIALVHNGIVENYEQFKPQLQKAGYLFHSETDTEVVAHLLHFYLKQGLDFLEAVRKLAKELEGAYAIGFINTSDPNRLLAIRKGCPLAIGIGQGEHFIASDHQALLPATQQFIFLEEGDIVDIYAEKLTIYDVQGSTINRKIHTSQINTDRVNRGQYRHYMLKEIFEQGQAIAETLEGRVLGQRLIEQAFGEKITPCLDQVKKVQIVACGTSYHAGMVARYWFEGLAGIPCQVEIASEIRYRKVVVQPGTLFVTLSQSGETADTLAALRAAKTENYVGYLTICNSPESSLVRESGLALITRAGQEIGVASTKAFTTQLVSLMMLCILLGRRHALSADKESELVQELNALPKLVERVLLLESAIQTLAIRFANKQHALFLGRGTHYPIALEGALKLKEISYIHAEAYPAGELKHGPLALIDKEMPVVAVAPNDELLEKLKSNLQEVKARGGELIVFADAAAGLQEGESVTIIEMPVAAKYLAPVLYTIPLQLLAYHAAVLKGTDIDQPRNLAKSVTVE